MGSIQVEDLPHKNEQANGVVGVLSSGQANGHVSGTVEVVGLAADHTSSPTGLRDEIVLLSWLLVLLRTQEDGRIAFDWAYKGSDGASQHELIKARLSTDEVLPSLEDKVGRVVTSISQHVAAVAPKPSSATSTPLSLLLSTDSLSQTPANATNEDAIHLEIRHENGQLEIHPVWSGSNILPFTLTRHINSLVDIIKACLSNPDASIQDCLGPTTQDFDAIWGWNHELPPTYNLCMHEVISEQARRYPDKEAICSWDGSFTYSQIDQYSTTVACLLQEQGVEVHDVLPVCFEKSRWTIVAVLGVMKAGGTFVLMDPTLPLARLQNMAQQVGAKMMVASHMQQDLAKSILPDGGLLTIDGNTFTTPSETHNPSKLPVVPPSALMYLIFTSGSTGTPKGVMISHTTYTSSAFPRARAVGYTEESRVLDFASYAFDVSIDSMLLTLGNGGCLCIPSDKDRLNDINGVIRKMQINYAGLTPSVGRILEPDVISSLTGLGLGGEAVSARDANVWGKDTRIIIGYGPCECTIGCTVNSSAATGRNYLSIGPGNGAAMWITDPENHDSLMPVGAVGELLVEGPIVGQGYLNDPNKTAVSFINDPSWLLAGHKNYTGRRGRLYKTGDLGRYDPDGSGGIVFVGRKDTQVKLRGQRVELGEIESQLRSRLPADTEVVAEVIAPQGGGQSMLVAFVASKSEKKSHECTKALSIECSDALQEVLSNINTELTKVLPRYMVPNVYVPVNYIPVLISGKIDRKQLRQFGTTVDLRQLDQSNQGSGNSTPSRELSDFEQHLRRAWSEVLKLDLDSIQAGDNFFALGGDSLAAMRLVAVCRTQGLDLSVVDTFSNPTLSAMARVVQSCDSSEEKEALPFSMISQSVESACIEASSACGSVPSAVEDIYPCTPTQESLFTFSLKSVKAYVAQRVACIPPHIDTDAWKKAWEEAVTSTPILRTRVAQLREPGLQQVILKGDISWTSSADLTQYLEDDRSQKMNLGESLARYAIVDNQEDGKRYMVWTVHHVLYDGWSEPLILKRVSNALQGQDIETQAQIKNFVWHVRHINEADMLEFWQRELKGAIGPQFPPLPSRDFLPTPDALIEHRIPLETGSGMPFTMATLIRGAWALVASQYTGSDDIVFGETLTGRDISLVGVEGIVGPLIATVPVRVGIRRSSSIEAYLQAIQQGMLARTQYQHMGMQNIRKVSPDAQHACETGTGLVIQPEPEYTGSELGFSQGDVIREALHFNPYPLMLACGIQKGGFRVCASFDSSLIEVAQMKRILVQLEMACSQLTKDLSRKLGEVSCLPSEELNQIWQWNQTPPLSLDPSSGQLRANSRLEPGIAYPLAVVCWVCDPRNSSLLSPIGCVGELWLEGAFSAGKAVESPAWLVAGSPDHPGRTGRVHSTGDLAQFKSDGTLVYMGRKENIIPVQGHAVNITDIEAHLSKHLSPTIRVAPAVAQLATDSNQQTSEQELVVFIEQQPADGNSVQLMSSEQEILHDASNPESFKMTISAKIPISLAAELRKLSKFVKDSLPGYMVPFAYVVVEQIPTATEKIDHTLLNQLASRIPPQVFTQLREGFTDAWAKSLMQSNLTASESILRSSWAEILGIGPEQIDVNDNFFRLGGDSVLAMKLVSNLRVQGHKLTVADIFQHMRLGDAATVLKVNHGSEEKIASYRPFSTLGAQLNIDLFVSEIVRPKLSNPDWSIQDVSPVTDSQALDIKGTIQAPRTSVQFNMLYFDQGISRDQLFNACNKLVKTHEILRTIFIEHESSFFQVVLQDLEAPVVPHQTGNDIKQYVNDLCMQTAESSFDLGSSFLKLFLVEHENGQACVVIGLSHAQYDGASLPRLLEDLEALYTGKEIVDFKPFTSYMALTRDERAETKALDYWRGLLTGSSLSMFDGASNQPTTKGLFQEKAVDIAHPLEEVTTASLLTAAWALLLARRQRKSDITFGGVTSGRNLDIGNAENVMGPCYQFTPIRVPFESHWTARDLLRFVQKQSAESAAYDFVGFERIQKQCTEWSPEAFFDSMTHHQDWDDFDTMPFADGSCRVDILNPHGDAAYPVKVVSFVRGGQMHVGVVGSEQNPAFVEAALDELVANVQELAMGQPDHVLLDSSVF